MRTIDELCAIYKETHRDASSTGVVDPLPCAVDAVVLAATDDQTKRIADLARVTAELDAMAEKLCSEDRDFATLRDDLERAQFNENANWHQAEGYRRDRDAARAQVRELLNMPNNKHAIAAAANNCGPRVMPYDYLRQALTAALAALPPSALEETADLDAERRSRAMGHLLTTWEPVVRAAVAFRKAPAYSEDASSACQTLEDAIDALPATSIPK